MTNATVKLVKIKSFKIKSFYNFIDSDINIYCTDRENLDLIYEVESSEKIAEKNLFFSTKFKI